MRVKELLFPDLFIEEGGGKIHFANCKYDGATLYDIDDYHFLYATLSGDLPESVYSTIKEHADFLRMAEEFWKEEASLKENEA